MSGRDEPEETAPFTHQPYGGGDGGDNPDVSPSGPAARPSGPSYVQPPVPPPPTPYGTPRSPQQPPPGWQPGWQPGWPPGWQQGWQPAYGAAYPGSQDHKGATTAVVLGIVSAVCLLGSLVCCLTLPGVLCAPFAWFTGARAVREIDRHPGVYGNRTSAVTGMWLGVVMTVLAVLAIAAAVALFAWIGYSDPSLV